MKTRYKYQTHISTIGDIKNLEQHFAIMAAKGWMIDKLGMFSFRYRACEPCEKRFFVDILPQITGFDYPDNEDARSYRQICEDSGWTFISAGKQIHVFCADSGATPVPIHTDDSVQAKIYLKVCRRYELLPYAVLLPLFGYQLYNSLIRSGAEIITSDLSTLVMLGFAIFIPVFLWILAATLIWYVRTVIAARRGLPMPVMGRRTARVRARLLAVVGTLFMLLIALGIYLTILDGASKWILLIPAMSVAAFGVGLYLRRQVDRHERKRGENIRMVVYAIIALIFVFFVAQSLLIPRFTPASSDPLDDRPVITLADLGVTDPPGNSSAGVEGSFLVPVNYSYWETGSQGSVDLRVYRPVSRALARGLFERQIESQIRVYDRFGVEYQVEWLSEEEAAVWGADAGAVFNRQSGSLALYLLRGRTVLRLDVSVSGVTQDTAAEAVRGLWERLLSY